MRCCDCGCYFRGQFWWNTFQLALYERSVRMFQWNGTHSKTVAVSWRQASVQIKRCVKKQTKKKRKKEGRITRHTTGGDFAAQGDKPCFCWTFLSDLCLCGMKESLLLCLLCFCNHGNGHAEFVLSESKVAVHSENFASQLWFVVWYCYICHCTYMHSNPATMLALFCWPATSVSHTHTPPHLPFSGCVIIILWNTFRYSF